MEDNKNQVAELTQGWAELLLKMKKNNKIEVESFEKVFTGTYTLLSQYSADANIDKKYIELILNAFLFAKAEVKDLYFKYYAMLVLTERMLNYCLSSNSATTNNETSVYVFETRKEIHINFNDVQESLNQLSKYLIENNWGKM